MSDSLFEPIVVTTTSDERPILEDMAQHLVRERLAACVQISGPIASCYRWQDKIEAASEFVCTIKTSRHLWGELQREIVKLHNYDEPQLIAVPVTAGSDGYLAWMRSNMK